MSKTLTQTPDAVEKGTVEFGTWHRGLFLTVLVQAKPGRAKTDWAGSTWTFQALREGGQARRGRLSGKLGDSLSAGLLAWMVGGRKAKSPKEIMHKMYDAWSVQHGKSS